MLDRVFKNIDARRSQSIAVLKDFLRIPSVSTKPEHARDVHRCADWLAGQLRQIGLRASVERTPGHPVVMAFTDRKPHRPTVLIYGHYDVQPAEPLDQWISPPFEPSERNGALFARGAVDDKGQIWAHVEAIRAWQEQGGTPVNIIALFEGEEEIGSENLESFLNQHRSDLRADIAVISDTGQFARGMPAITYGLRGLAYMEVFITGPAFDLHSGSYGGAVPNPANVLAELLATLHNPDGTVNIPGFYDDVLPLSKAERDQFARLPHDDAEYAREIGVPGLAGEVGFSTLERCSARPTCDINGLTSGYQGPGAKTIIPCKASAKVSMRLVPKQDPKKIEAAFMQAMRDRCPRTVAIEFAQHSSGHPVIVPLEGRPTQLAAAAIKQGFGIDPVFIREGGSIPVVGQIKAILGMDTLLVGFGLPDDRVHSPNEKFDLDCLYYGTRTAAALYAQLADL